MSNEHAIELTEIEPVGPAAPGDSHADPLDPGPAGAPTPPAAENQEPPERRRWRFVPRSLSSRLVIFVTGLVIVVVAAAGAATYVALKSFLYERLDQQVSGLATSNAASVRISLERCQATGETDCTIFPTTNPDAGFHAAQRQWIAVLDQHGNQLVSRGGNEISVMQLSTAQRRSLLANPDQVRTLTTQDGVTLRVEGEGAGQVLVASGLSTDEVDRTLHRLVWLEVAIGLLAVAVALGLTSWGVHLSLRPLNRVTRTARDVTAELSPDGAGLDRRVPVGDEQTEVGELAESFNTLLGAVETQFAARVESEDRMRQFLADASHELRTPLTSIRGYAELSRLRRANGENLPDDTMDRIESEGTRMSRLVDDLLLLARSDQGGEPQWERVDVGQLIEDAVEGARAAYPERRIDAAFPATLTVLGDRDQLLRVLRNLITNAAVHTPAGPIRVSGNAEGDEIVLRVADAGPGLPPEEAQHVFERFWRADKARTRARGGSGLGLAIVASIVQSHGGTVRFDSSVEQGSTVAIRLPVRPAPQPDPTATSDESVWESGWRRQAQ